MFQVKNVLI